MIERRTAGPGEVVVEHFAVRDADRALEGGQVLGEALEHFQHRVLVGQEDVAPYRRVRRGDAGEVAEAAGRIFDDFALGASSRSDAVPTMVQAIRTAVGLRCLAVAGECCKILQAYRLEHEL
jgi:hypothetical protein